MQRNIEIILKSGTLYSGLQIVTHTTYIDFCMGLTTVISAACDGSNLYCIYSVSYQLW